MLSKEAVKAKKKYSKLGTVIKLLVVDPKKIKFTFNAVRFLIGFLAITPLVFLFEIKKFKSEFKSDTKTFINLSFLIGLSLFLGSALQQVSLLYTDVANAAFFTIFYVPLVQL